MKVALTGASGYVGRHVLSALQQLECCEIVVATRTTMTTFKKDSSTTTVHFDLNEDSTDAFYRLGKPDLLIHLAWGGLSDYMDRSHFEEELPKHYDFLKNMVVSGVKSIFIAGTCFEYGLLTGALSEDMVCEPVTPYGYAKNCLRQQLYYLKKEYDFKLTWARVFYLSGTPPGRKNLFSALETSVTNGDTSFNMSQGDQLRDFLSVGNAANLICELALKMLDIGVVNLCSGDPVSVKSLVDDRISQMGWNIKLNLGYYPYPDYEPMAFWGDTEKLKNYSERM